MPPRKIKPPAKTLVAEPVPTASTPEELREGIRRLRTVLRLGGRYSIPELLWSSGYPAEARAIELAAEATKGLC